MTRNDVKQIRSVTEKQISCYLSSKGPCLNRYINYIHTDMKAEIKSCREIGGTTETVNSRKGEDSRVWRNCKLVRQSSNVSLCNKI